MKSSTSEVAALKALRLSSRGAALWLCLLVACTMPALAQVNGAIYTTTADGTTVNGNIYDAKADVYLTGGPQNQHDKGLSPDGVYYYQVTDPSGAVLLSTDDVTCRQVVVSGGRIIGVPSGAPPPTCTTGYHALGTQNDSNGNTPVQLLPYNDTPNPGGEYKAWVTPVANYSPDPNNLQCSSKKSNVVYGFCDSDSKTDNYKIKASSSAYVAVCKFNDLNGNGVQDDGEPLIPHWPITATGVDGGTVTSQTDDQGCVSFTYSGFKGNQNSQAVTLAEGSLPGWQQTAPADGTQGAFTISGGVISFNLQPGDKLQSPNFGNICLSDGCGGTGLTVTKDANPSLTRTFKWDITKSVDKTQINTSNSATANYTVTVTHDAGTDSGWEVMGNIRLSNPTPVDISGISVTDAVDNGGTCRITGGGPNGDGTDITVPSGDHLDVPYICNYTSLPAAGINTATAYWDQTSGSGTALVDFSLATINAVDGTVNVTDTLGGTLGTITYTDPSPKTFTYPITFTDPAGTCTTHPNTATYTSTSNSSTTGSASQSVKVCVGKDAVVTKTATGSFTPGITKTVCKTKFQGAYGTFSPLYTVTVSESSWVVKGNITVVNPNDWEDLGVLLSDSLNLGGNNCTINGGNFQTVARSSSISPSYTCTFTGAPSATSGTNTATGTWDNTAYFTPGNNAFGLAGFSFDTLTVTDTFNGVKTTLGTIPGNVPSTTYKYAQKVTNTTGGKCQTYTNIAEIVGTGLSDSQTIHVCNTATSAKTIGYWQNKNGQGIISGGAASGGACNSGAWLRQYAPFQDLGSGSSCSGVATYVYNVVKAANAGGSTMNAQLKAQMLSTALDVYFGDATLGGNLIGAPTAIGTVNIDLTQVCSIADSTNGTGTCNSTYQSDIAAFGGTTKLTVSGMLSYAASQSTLGGTTWYGNVKATQSLAKNAFDAINNQAAYIGF